ncbi:MAG: MFS transporter [Burkholderiaceae bacterium]
MNERTSTRTPAWSLRVLALAYFIMGTGSLAVVGTLPGIARSLAVDPDASAPLVTALAFTFAIGAPGLQVLVGHWPRRRLILCGLAMMAIGALATAFADGYGGLMAARICTGLGAAAIGPVASALGAGLVPAERKGHALAVVFSGMTLASVVGVPLSAWLGATFGWRACFVLVAALTIGVAALVGWLVDAGQRGSRIRVGDLLAIVRDPAAASGVIVMVATMTAIFATYTLIVPILQQQFGVGAEGVSFALLVFGAAGIAGNGLARVIAVRWPATRALTVALIVLAAVFIAWTRTPAVYPLALVLLIVWAVASDVFMPSQQRRLVELAPGASGLVLALNASALYAGMALGAYVAAVVAPRAGTTSLPWVSAGFIGLALAALGVSGRAAA